jgi:hypothetical protein
LAAAGEFASLHGNTLPLLLAEIAKDAIGASRPKPCSISFNVAVFLFWKADSHEIVPTSTPFFSLLACPDSAFAVDQSASAPQWSHADWPMLLMEKALQIAFPAALASPASHGDKEPCR